MGKVVVVLDWLEGGLFAVQAQMMRGDWRWEEGLNGGNHGEAGAEDGD